MSCVVHVENAPQERRTLFGMFGGKDREMRIREAYHVKDPSCATGIAAIIEYEKMSSVSTAISTWNGRPQYVNGPPLKVQEVNLEFYCSILKTLYEKDIALRELQQEHDKLRKTLQAELPKGPKAMKSPKRLEKLSSHHNARPRCPASEQVSRPSVQNSSPCPLISQRINAEAHVTPREIDPCHKPAPDDLFPKMFAAFEQVQEIVERGHKETSHGARRPLNKGDTKDVNQSSIFVRRGDEQKLVTSLGEENRYKKRKTYEDSQTDMFHTYHNSWIGTPSSLQPISIDHRTPTRKLGHPTPSPSIARQTPTLIHAHTSLASRKSLGGTLVEGSGIRTVSASEAFLKGYIEGQAMDKQQDVRWRTLGYR